MPEVQEDITEGAIKWMLKVSRLSAELIVAGLKALIKAIANKEPVGIQKIDKLMKGTDQKLEQVKLTFMGKDMKDFKKLAQKYGVGFTAFKSGEEYTLFFRANRTDQMKSCIEAYAKQKLERPSKEGIRPKLDKAIRQEAVERIEPALKEAREHNKVQTRGRGSI